MIAAIGIVVTTIGATRTVSPSCRSAITARIITTTMPTKPGPIAPCSVAYSAPGPAAGTCAGCRSAT